MNRPRLVKGLKIAWTEFWSVAAIILALLWARSYYVQDCLRGYPPNSWKYNVMEVASQRGRVGGYFTEGYGPRHTKIVSMPIDDDNEWYQWLISELGFDVNDGTPRVSPRGVAFVFPHWLPVCICATSATLPWLPFKRFSLQTLLIAATLVALVLGLIAWTRQ